MTVLSPITSPADLKKLPAATLDTLSQEIREFLIAKVSEAGGHLRNAPNWLSTNSMLMLPPRPVRRWPRSQIRPKMIVAVAGDPEINCTSTRAASCLIPRPPRRFASAARSESALATGRRSDCTDDTAAFINPAVIHRAAALHAHEQGKPFTPFAYREGVAIGGSTASLPVRYVAAGALAGIQGLIGMLARAHRPNLGRSVSRLLAQALRAPAMNRPASGWSPGAGKCLSGPKPPPAARYWSRSMPTDIPFTTQPRAC